MSTPSEDDILSEAVKKIGIGGLANFDGCACGGFEIRNVRVRFNCGKGSHHASIVFSSRSLEYYENGADTLERDLPKFIAEVSRQARAMHYRLENAPVEFESE